MTSKELEEKYLLFANRVSVTDSCWEWTGTINTHGYGVLYYNYGNERAHRFSYQYFKGRINDGKMVLHTCNNKKCVNPNHLYEGTASDNMQDFLATGEHWQTAKTHCKNGHLLKGDNVLIIKSTGHRQCRQCKKEWKLNNKDKVEGYAEKYKKDGRYRDRYRKSF